jgi:oligopeptide transport system substrate-binding protein
MELWEKGELEYLRPDTDSIETYIDDPRLHEYDTLYVYHLDLNCQNPNNPISGTLEYRKALYHAMNREIMGQSIFGYMKPSGTYVNGQAGIYSEGARLYRESTQGKAVAAMVEQWGPWGYNPTLAREYLAKAYEKAGLAPDTVITLTYAYESESYWRACGEYLQAELPIVFEGKIKVDIITHAGMSGTDYKKTGDDKWDIAPNEWQRTGARNYPYQVFYYYTDLYPTGPNNYYVDEFNAAYAAADASELKTDYDKMLDATKTLEEIYLEYVIHVPLVQDTRYELFAEYVELPVEIYVPGLGWGWEFGDIVK